MPIYPGFISTTNCPNFTGELFALGEGMNRSSFTKLMGFIGGITTGLVPNPGAGFGSLINPSGQIAMTGSSVFKMKATYDLGQPNTEGLSENDLASGINPEYVTADMGYGVIQPFMLPVQSTYYNESASQEYTANINTGRVDATPPIGGVSKLGFQISAAIARIQQDYENACINGIAQYAVNNNTKIRMGGLIPGCTVNNVDAAGVALSKPLVTTLLTEMYNNKAEFSRMAFFVNATQREKLTDLYTNPTGYITLDPLIGGARVDIIRTNYGEIMVFLNDKVPNDTLLCVDMDHVRPMIMEAGLKGGVFYEPKQQVGAAEGGIVYGQLGLDYNSPVFHGVITNLLV